jgi:hypothetical protein
LVHDKGVLLKKIVKLRIRVRHGHLGDRGKPHIGPMKKLDTKEGRVSERLTRPQLHGGLEIGGDNSLSILMMESPGLTDGRGGDLSKPPKDHVRYQFCPAVSIIAQTPTVPNRQEKGTLLGLPPNF